jgi:hypothetical protein
MWEYGKSSLKKRSPQKREKERFNRNFIRCATCSNFFVVKKIDLRRKLKKLVSLRNKKIVKYLNFQSFYFEFYRITLNIVKEI